MPECKISSLMKNMFLFLLKLTEFSERQVRANIVDPDQIREIRLLLEEQSDQGHCLPFRLHLFDPLLYS